MKIIRNKKTELGRQEFICDNCSSEFETDDYNVHKSIEELQQNARKGREVLPVYKLTRKCPVCEYDAEKSIATGEPAYWTVNYDW